MSQDLSHCKCGKAIIFLPTKSGKRMPVDTETVGLTDEVFDHTKHMSHFATCKFSTDFRKKKTTKKGNQNE